MNIEQEVKITVRVLHEDLDPQAVTNLLGVKPTYANKKGDPRSRPTYAPFSFGQWGLHIDLAPSEPLAKHISALTMFLESKMVEMRILRSQGWDVEIYAAIFREAQTLDIQMDQRLMTILSRLEIPINLSLHSLSPRIGREGGRGE